MKGPSPLMCLGSNWVTMGANAVLRPWWPNTRSIDPAVHLLAKIVHGADVKQDLFGRPEAPGLEAIAEGFRYLGLKDDHEVLEKEFIVYDALYAYCRQKVQEEKS